MKMLTRKEELIMQAVYWLEDEASMVSIRKFLIKNTGRRWSPGNVYVALDSLYKRKYLDYVIGESSPRRGGKAKKFYRRTKKGKAALAELKRIHDRFWVGAPEAAAKE